MNKVLIFTGAGASAPLGLPTTKNFSSEIFRNPRPVTELANHFLNESGDDIERLLSLLEDFEKNSEFTELIINEIPDQGFILNKNTFPISHTNIKEVFKRHIATTRSQTSGEIKRIKGIVYEKLQNYNKENSKNLYNKLIKEIKETFKDCSITYCTANYDLTFDAALEIDSEFYESIGITDINYGFKLKHGKLVYDQNQSHAWQPEVLEYLKVHGSLDWHPDALTGNCVKSGANVTPKDPDEMMILYPGFKGTPEKEPFISLHDKLESRINSSDIVIIIGFAFRDPYINAIFDSAIRSNKNKKFILFNPSKASELPKDSIIPQLSRNNNFHHIEQGIEIKDTPLNIKKLISQLTQKENNKTTQTAPA